MARPRKHSLSPSAQIANALIQEIVSGSRAVGSKLPSQRALARRFKTSQTSISRAFAILAADGYVKTRRGAGVFVLDRPAGLQMADCALLCMPATGHIFGEMTKFLHDRLASVGLVPSTLSLEGRDECMLRRALYSEIRFVLVTGGALFPFGAIEARTLATKHVIAVMAWESDHLLDRVHRILVDHAAGMQLLADHLWNAGHRTILFAGPPNMIAHAGNWDGKGQCPCRLNVQGTGLNAMWIRRGGRIIPFFCHHERTDGAAFDTFDLQGLLSEQNPPTAVVGLRDVDAWDLQNALGSHTPALASGLKFFGSGDTPWSHGGKPPFSSLTWNLEKIADLAVGIIRDINAGATFKAPVVRMIPPKLVLRCEG